MVGSPALSCGEDAYILSFLLVGLLQEGRRLLSALLAPQRNVPLGSASGKYPWEELELYGSKENQKK